MKLQVVKDYVKAMSSAALVWMAIGYITQVATDLGSNIWLSKWSEDTSNPDGAMNPNVRVGVYGGIGGAQSK